MKLLSFTRAFFVICLFQCCKDTADSKNLQTVSIDTATIKKSETENEAAANIHLHTHLKDTITVSGSFILFLIPDSARFESYEEESGIFDADADFGVGMSNTIDSISKNERYKTIRTYTSSCRYIIIRDCIGGPVTIDRDSTSYGIILSSPGKKIVTRYNDVHSGDYLQNVEDYFGLKN